MTHAIKTPFLGTNDSQAVVQNWTKNSGTLVKHDEVVCELETTKATVEVSSEMAGYLHLAVQPGETVKVGQILAVISDSPVFDMALYLAESLSTLPGATSVTKKAEILMARYKLDPEEIRRQVGSEKITEDVVKRHIEKLDDHLGRMGVGKGKRVGVIGGVGGGGALIVVDALTRMPGFQATAIFDRDSKYVGCSVLGIPVVGPIDDLYAEFESGRIDAVVIAFNRDLMERDRVFQDIKAKGIPFVNVIDPTVELRSDVILGSGNVILSRAYIGACSVIGDNNFISANVAIEHGNILGSSCAFGPGVFTSGNVTIGSRVRFGTGIFIEPGLTIGDDATIGTGQMIVTDIRSGITLTTRAKS
jgi:sugar O-acyltransferase (sialic acid O-acetyltransferase NeuD family)